MKFVALLFGFFVFGVSAFAAAAGYTPSTDLSPATVIDSTPAGIFAAIVLTTPFDTSVSADNTALISQDGMVNPNVGYIDQSGGTGNFAALLQDGSNGSHNTSIYQTGSHNSSVIYQH